jgi:hypothetical protein
MWDYGRFWWEVREVPGWNGNGSGNREGIGEGRDVHRREDDGFAGGGGLGNGSADARCGDRAYSGSLASRFSLSSETGGFFSCLFARALAFGHADVHLLVGHVVTEFNGIDPFGSRIVFQVGADEIAIGIGSLFLEVSVVCGFEFARVEAAAGVFFQEGFVEGFENAEIGGHLGQGLIVLERFEDFVLDEGEHAFDECAIPGLVADLEGLSVAGGLECFGGVGMMAGVEALESGPAGDEAKANGTFCIKDFRCLFVAVLIAEFDDEVFVFEGEGGELVRFHIGSKFKGLKVRKFKDAALRRSQRTPEFVSFSFEAGSLAGGEESSYSSVPGIGSGAKHETAWLATVLTEFNRKETKNTGRSKEGRQIESSFPLN